MLRIFFCLALSFAAFSCQGNGQETEDTFSFDRLSLSKYPTKVPTSLPRSFLPQNAKYVNAIELRSGFSNPKEAYLSLESQDSMEEIQKVLETRSSFGDWKLVQKEKVDTKVVYLFEGFIKKSMTIIVYNKGDHRLLKYYFKKQTNY